ncbi:MAG: hypothetical protein IJ593_10165 [Lachnospiraceae bacterium]|nr:hypothetical protein [Lachnospiraceae bacterium]
MLKTFHNELTDKLMDTISKLKTKNECYDFFEDLCTIKEILDMSRRLESAKLLDKGKTYNEIIEKVGISTATLSRISKALNYGTGGYKKAIEQ